MNPKEDRQGNRRWMKEKAGAKELGGLPPGREILYYALTLDDPDFGEKITPLILSGKRLITFGPADAGKTAINDQVEYDISEQSGGGITTKRVKNDEEMAKLTKRYPGFPDVWYPAAGDEYSDKMYKAITQPLASDERLVAELTAVGPTQNRGRSTLRKVRQAIADGQLTDTLILIVAADPQIISQNAPLRGKVPTTPNKDVLSTVWRDTKTRIVFDKEKVRGLTREQLGFLAKMLFGRKGKPTQVELFSATMKQQRENELKGMFTRQYLDALKKRIDRRAYSNLPISDVDEYLKIIGQDRHILYDEYGFDEEYAKVLINPFLDEPKTMFYDMQHYDDDTALYNSTVWTPAKSRRG